MRMRPPVVAIGMCALACSASSSPTPRSIDFDSARPPVSPAPVVSPDTSPSTPQPGKQGASVLDAREGERLCVVERRFEGGKSGQLLHVATRWTFRDPAGRTLRIVLSAYPEVDEPAEVFTMSWDGANRLVTILETRPGGQLIETRLSFEEHGALASMNGPDGPRAFSYEGTWHESKEPAPNAPIVPEEDEWLGGLSLAPQPWLPFTGKAVEQSRLGKLIQRYDKKGYWVGGTLESTSYKSEEEIVRAKDGRILERRFKSDSQGSQGSWTLVYTHEDGKIVMIKDESNGNVWRYEYATDGRMAKSTYETKTSVSEVRYERHCPERAASGEGW